MMLAVSTRPEWFADAACAGADVDLFFEPRGMPPEGWPYREAATYCVRCPVREECLDYAIANNVRHGFWGGKTERQRRMISRLRRQS